MCIAQAFANLVKYLMERKLHDMKMLYDVITNKNQSVAVVSRHSSIVTKTVMFSEMMIMFQLAR